MHFKNKIPNWFCILFAVLLQLGPAAQAQRYVKEVATMQALKDLNTADIHKSVFVKGYFAANDGGEGFFYWDSSDTTATNRGTVLKGKTTGAELATGRWNRVHKQDGELNVRWFGVAANGASNDSAAIQDAATVNASGAVGRVLRFPAGRYAFNYKNDGKMKMVGAGIWSTFLIPYTNDAPVIWHDTNTSTNNNGAIYSDFTIDGEDKTDSIGMRWGEQSVGHAGNSGNTLQRVRIINCKLYGMEVRDATEMVVRDVRIEDCDGAGVLIDSETSSQLLDWDITVRQCPIGIFARSGSRFQGRVRVESCGWTGLYIEDRASNGFRYCVLENFYGENNGWDNNAPSTAHTTIQPKLTAAARATLYSTGASPTNQPYNVRLIGGNFASNASAYTVSVDGGFLTFENAMIDDFTSSKIRWGTTAGASFILFRQCGTFAAAPSPTVYASFPSGSVGGPGTSTLASYGAFYDYWHFGRRYQNLPVFGTASNPLVSALTPAFHGEEVRDGASRIWKAIGATASDWKMLAPITTLVKSADQTVNNTTTFADITDFSYAMVTNRTYRFRGVIYFNDASTASGIRLTMTGPSTPTSLFYSMVFQDAAGTVKTGALPSTTYGVVHNVAVTVAGLRVAYIDGLVMNGSNAGNLKVQFAQSSAEAADTTVKAGSFLTVEAIN